jgi:hypothetical protein
LVDEIDEEVFEWLKISLKFISTDFETSFLIEYLLKHVPKTPLKVAEIYLMMLNNKVYPDYDRNNIIKIVEILYAQGQAEIADKICNMYGEEGFDFLRNIYNKNKNEKT